MLQYGSPTLGLSPRISASFNNNNIIVVISSNNTIALECPHDLMFRLVCVSRCEYNIIIVNYIKCLPLIIKLLNLYKFECFMYE